MSDERKPTTKLSREMGIPPDFDRLAPAFRQLCETVAALRAPTGCPWDRIQTLETIKPYTLEETYELLEAIDSGDDDAIVEELGDVLLQVVLDAQIGSDEGRFELLQVVERLTDKMIRRHPHVFGDETADTPEDVSQHWQAAKQAEKPERVSALDGIPIDLPQLARAARITSRAAQVGYDFPDRNMLFDKLNEEISELAHELFDDGQIPHVPAGVAGPVVPDERVNDAGKQSLIAGELGDVLFVLANIARRWGINPEEALRNSNRKFTRRFQSIELELSSRGVRVEDATLAEMEECYQAEKRREC
jgi:tetrapyrrole methylase family protein/MazG family protein